MKKFFFLPAVLIAFSACLASSAQADVITNWSFDVSSAFTSWLGPQGTASGDVKWQNVADHTNRTGKNSGISFNDSYTKMDWSSYDAKGLRSSSLALETYSGDLDTNGSYEAAMKIVHDNKTVGNTTPTPKIMDISVQVVLTGMYEDGSSLSQNINMNLQLGFIETPNKGYGQKAEHTQDDIFFIVANEGATENFTDAFGNDYTVSMQAIFDALGGIDLETADYYINERFEDYYNYDPSKPLYGWSTLEGESTEHNMKINLVVEPATSTTPEPATWVMLALAGAAGFPLYRRSRKLRQ